MQIKQGKASGDRRGQQIRQESTKRPPGRYKAAEEGWKLAGLRDFREDLAKDPEPLPVRECFRVSVKDPRGHDREDGPLQVVTAGIFCGTGTTES